MDDAIPHSFSVSASFSLEILSPLWNLKIRYIVIKSLLLVLNMSQTN
jgi:hypothetical protein